MKSNDLRVSNKRKDMRRETLGPAALRAILRPLGMGRFGKGFTTSPLAAITIKRRKADSVGRKRRSTDR